MLRTTSCRSQAVITSQEGGWAQWEDGPNHVLLVPASGAASMAVKVEWGAGTAVLNQELPLMKVRGRTRG
jgi:hypothetical protein